MDAQPTAEWEETDGGWTIWYRPTGGDAFGIIEPHDPKGIKWSVLLHNRGYKGQWKGYSHSIEEAKLALMSKWLSVRNDNVQSVVFGFR